MKKRRRSVIALLVTGIVGMIAIGASSASAAINSTSTTTLGIHAFVDNGFSGALVGVPGGLVHEECLGNTSTLALVGSASNGQARSNYVNESGAPPSERAFAADDLDTGDALSMNDAGIGNEVTGDALFVNGNQNRTLTIQYAVEDTPSNSTADCSVWGTAVKGLG